MFGNSYVVQGTHHRPPIKSFSISIKFDTMVGTIGNGDGGVSPNGRNRDGGVSPEKKEKML